MTIADLTDDVTLAGTTVCQVKAYRQTMQRRCGTIWPEGSGRTRPRTGTIEQKAGQYESRTRDLGVNDQQIRISTTL